MNIDTNAHPLTFAQTIELHALTTPDRVAFRFLPKGDVDDSMQVLTYGDLAGRVRHIATQLADAGAAGEPVALVCDPGLDFVAGFFGILAADAIAVPAAPPAPGRQSQTLPRFRSLMRDAAPAAILTTRGVDASLGDMAAELELPLPAARLILSDATLNEEIDGPWAHGDAIAFLQYTSGSTSEPKGVAMSHANIAHNLRAQVRSFQLSHDSELVYWLPPYHDMGLGGIMQTVHLGCSTTIMPPLAFLQRPLRWLRAISRFRGTTSGGPNFAYDLCVRRCREQDLETLDLRSWMCAFNGAEPVRAETLDRFASRFERAGFNRDALFPCYGLAESTLLVTCGSVGVPARRLSVSARALQAGRVRTPREDEDEGDPAEVRVLVSSGTVPRGSKVLVVDPDLRVAKTDREVGEVWAQGPSVARDYWQRPEVSERTFQARLANGDGPYLRTGDLGFFDGGELFVTGRSKELIIVRGRNHYPHDIEETLGHSHPAIRPDNVVAFSSEVDHEERLVVVIGRLGVLDDDEARAIADAAALAVLARHEVLPYEVLLLAKGTVPKTTSGKVQRGLVRARYQRGELDIQHRWRPDGEDGAKSAAAVEPRRSHRDGEIEGWLVEDIAGRLGVPTGSIDVDAPFTALGLDSLNIVELSGDLAEWLGRELSPVLVYDHPSIRKLARHLGDRPVARDSNPVGAAKSTIDDDPIAVVGIGCRFPGDVHGPDDLWSLLLRDGDAVTERPRRPGELHIEGLSEVGGYLSEVDRFDAAFFGITPREASSVDPQHRLMLEVTWEALEHAGIRPSSLEGQSVAVFVGASTNDYGELALRAAPHHADRYETVGNAYAALAGRVSYHLGLRGPSVSVDTACSSSLVSVHLACQSLRQRESRLALAGGVSLILTSHWTDRMTRLGALSPTGQCRPFAAEADGYVRSEGCGVVVLKRLSDAQADGDSVLAIIRGSAVNQDGRTNGLTAPSAASQADLIRAALARAEIAPAEVDYVEAHGSATPLGDPIEVGALAATYGAARSPAQPLRIGSIKSNLGHTEAAAGIAGLLKAVLALRHGVLPASLHAANPNPNVPWGDARVSPVTECTPWPDRGRPRRAAVSAFGFTGTNAHVVLESACAGAKSEPRAPESLLVLRAEDLTALRFAATDAAARLDGATDLDLAAACRDLASAHGEGSEHLAMRVSLRDHASDLLRSVGRGHTADEVKMARATERAPLAVVFDDDCSVLASSPALFRSQPVFRDVLLRAAETLHGYQPEPLLAMLGIDGGRDLPAPLDETPRGHAALVAFHCAMFEQWSAWGVVPDQVVGHGVGEISAAYAAGVLTLGDALELAAARGRLIDELSPVGAVTVIDASADVIAPRMARRADQLGLAAIDGPGRVRVAGEPGAVAAFERELSAEGIVSRRLPVDRAVHSPLVAACLPELDFLIASFDFAEPEIPLLSSVTGRLLTEEDALTLGHWRSHTRDTVRFDEAVRGAREMGTRRFLVIGSAGATAAAAEGDTWIPSLNRGVDSWASLLDAAAELSLHGHDLDALIGDLASRRGPVLRDRVPALPFVLSARSETSLRLQAGQLRDCLATTDSSLHDVARTLALGRDAMDRRAVIVANDRPSLIEALDALDGGAPHPSVFTGASTGEGKIVFVFPGQGSQWPAMGRALLEESDAFRLRLEVCDRAIARHVGWSVIEVLLGRDERSLDEVEVVQPVLFAVMVALAEVWRSLGVEPDAVIGHSQGEVAAAYVAGALSLDDAARIVCVRSRALRALEGHGGMAAVEAGVDTLLPHLDAAGGRLVIAGFNGPSSTVVSGDPEALDELVATLTDADVFARRVRATIASHGPQIDAIRGPITAGLEGLRPRASRVAMISTVTGEWIEGPELDADYWYRNLREPVRFHDAATALVRTGHRAFVEVSPHPLLCVAISSILAEHELSGVTVSTLRRDHGGLGEVLRSLATAHAQGIPFDDERWFGAGPGATLPTYAFDRSTHWHASIGADFTDVAPTIGAVGAHITDATRPEVDDSETAETLADELHALLPRDRRRRLLALVRGEVAAVIRLPADRVPPAQPLRDLGLDSLMAVELCRRINAATGLQLPATLLFNHPTADALTAVLDERLHPVEATELDRARLDPGELAGLTRTIASMSPTELSDAGLLEPLLRLSRRAATSREATTNQTRLSEIDALDADALIDLAMDDS